MNRSDILEERIFWTPFNGGEYKLRLLNDKIVGVGDQVLVKFDNGNFKGTIKQVAGFGIHENRAIVLVIFPGRKNGKKIHIDNIIDKI